MRAKFPFLHNILDTLEISKNLGIGASTLHKWIKLFTETGEFGRGSGNFASDKDKEIARLKRQLRDAEGAIEVLKKSIGILSK
ncbi:Transposase ISLasa14 [Limosilactobacillus fermentum F-6]|uniref:transposase n=1 Tax=Limosilactobacillus fermentum TaxID=1613 RepID=UPI00032ABE7A|nr:transposase [Limosilactobacillus fermentum]AGL88603.1 Transposase ISLasa14 [Limosilactobacillus fermentum F-6]